MSIIIFPLQKKYFRNTAIWLFCNTWIIWILDEFSDEKVPIYGIDRIVIVQSVKKTALKTREDTCDFIEIYEMNILWFAKMKKWYTESRIIFDQ